VVGFCGILGLLIGSFLNVVIYRVPAGLSVVSPGSACPGCGVAVSPRDNVPVLSWLLLRGRCRACHRAISARYPLVESLTGVVFLLTALRFGASWSLPAELAFVAGALALAAVDLERYLLPKAILYPTLILVGVGLIVATVAMQRWGRLGVAVACGLGAFAVFFVIQFVRPAWMGFGDVRLAGLLGLGLGWLGPWYLFVGFLVANILGSTVGIGLMLSRRATRKTALPYGVFLTAGAVVALLLGAPIIHWYSHLMSR